MREDCEWEQARRALARARRGPKDSQTTGRPGVGGGDEKTSHSAKQEGDKKAWGRTGGTTIGSRRCEALPSSLRAGQDPRDPCRPWGRDGPGPGVGIEAAASGQWESAESFQLLSTGPLGKQPSESGPGGCWWLAESRVTIDSQKRRHYGRGRGRPPRTAEKKAQKGRAEIEEPALDAGEALR